MTFDVFIFWKIKVKVTRFLAEENWFFVTLTSPEMMKCFNLHTIRVEITMERKKRDRREREKGKRVNEKGGWRTWEVGWSDEAREQRKQKRERTRERSTGG